MALCLNKQAGPAGHLDLRTIRRCRSGHEEADRLAEVGLSETCQRCGFVNERLALFLTDVSKVHLAVAFSLHLRSRVFVKAACGKTARAVWAADGGQRLTARLLRPDYCRGCARSWLTRLS